MHTQMLMVLTDDSDEYLNIAFEDMNEVARYFRKAADTGAQFSELSRMRFVPVFRLVEDGEEVRTTCAFYSMDGDADAE